MRILSIILKTRLGRRGGGRLDVVDDVEGVDVDQHEQQQPKQPEKRQETKDDQHEVSAKKIDNLILFGNTLLNLRIGVDDPFALQSFLSNRI